MSDFFNNDITFDVAANDFQLEKVRLFGERLLHVELNAAYGKKEIVCDRDNAIQNFVMLQSKDGKVERFEIFASYRLSLNGNIEIKLCHNDGVSEIWNIDINGGTLTASGEKTLCGTLMLSAVESI